MFTIKNLIKNSYGEIQICTLLPISPVQIIIQLFLDPSTSRQISVNEAKKLEQCTVLEPGQEINTMVKIYAGENIK